MLLLLLLLAKPEFFVVGSAVGDSWVGMRFRRLNLRPPRTSASLAAALVLFFLGGVLLVAQVAYFSRAGSADSPISRRVHRGTSGDGGICQRWQPTPHGHIPDSPIPRVIHLVWKSTQLFDQPAELDAEWRRKEPTFTRHVVNDSECRELAARFPDLLPRYDKLPMNVMRADICRVLAVYYLGGIYMDLDVAWVRPLDHWLDLWVPSGIVTGWETDEHVCNWFFAARSLHPCLKAVLELQTARAGTVSDQSRFKDAFRTNEAIVHEVTGPAVFTLGILSSCPFQPIFSPIGMNSVLIHHLYGSQVWIKSSSYSSWTRERSAVMGRQDSHLDEYQRTPANALFRPPDPADPGLELAVIASSRPLPSLTGHIFCPPEHAVDGDIETYAQTSQQQQSFLELHLNHPLAIPWSASGNVTSSGTTNLESGDGGRSSATLASTLTCLRFYARRDGNTHTFFHLRISLLTDGGVELFRSQELNTAELSISRVLTLSPTVAHSALVRDGRGMDVGVSVIRIQKLERGSLGLAEVQIYTDAACQTPRRLILRDSRRFSELSLELFERLTTVEKSCQSMALLGSAFEKTFDGTQDNLWGVCMTALQRASPCAVLSLASLAGLSFEDAVANLSLGCRVHVLTQRQLPVSRSRMGVVMEELWVAPRRYVDEQRKRNASQLGSLKSIRELFAAFPPSSQRVSLLRLDVGGDEWGILDELLDLISEGGVTVEQLLLQLHLWEPSEASVEERLGVLRRLQQQFIIVYYRVDRRETIRIPFRAPGSIRLTLLQRSILNSRSE